ncbi:hypothetical protein OBO34_19365 [Clostridiales Family XIII bacterium ASD5510]|uniref:Uncharacterized protein n=1 Tax=Hominibacterium faecale TaxID=2839743 RepID=A0A9J6QY86_9FIRM|nr:hypothetical protein [Hominibacterium faecale]MCU7380475.1 hypothetical protein [Hominibacterium faecale]
MNNVNALAEIQSKYKNCNLLIPAATTVQINPFYKCSVMEVFADTSKNSGDIFSVGKVKTGEDKDGKAIYTEVFSLAKPLLMKLATAAGIQFHPEYTTVSRENTNTYVGKAYGAVRLPDGSYKTHAETKRICLDDEEAKYRLEFIDKSIMGIHEYRAAKAASGMFNGEWKEDPDNITPWGKPDRYYVIADSDRGKYVERSMLVNMTLLRKTASEKAQTGAILRVVRALLGIKGTYFLKELSKPFAVPSVTFAPDYNDPVVRQSMLQQGMASMGNMFGTAAVPPAITSDAFTVDAFNNLDIDAEVETENSAFLSDLNQEEGEAIFDSAETPPWDQQPDQETQDYQCAGCGAEISEKVHIFSVSKYGRPLCLSCQKGEGR